MVSSQLLHAGTPRQNSLNFQVLTWPLADLNAPKITGKTILGIRGRLQITGKSRHIFRCIYEADVGATPASNKVRQAINLIAKSPRLDKEAIGSTRFKAAMSLRNHCLIYRHVPAALRSTVLTLIDLGVTLLEGLHDVPPDTAYQRWLQE